uniref:Uncharacterized protein n=1 Tax=Oncorhynchus tshawytscha TaxID=74940 RepID=A0A8C8BWW0_ONCTS
MLYSLVYSLLYSLLYSMLYSLLYSLLYFLLYLKEGCATDLYRHPQLDMDIDSVKAIYADTAVSVREHGSIDDVDVDMLINVSFLDDEVARAWKIVPTEPIIVRLRFSLSQYLNGPAPSVEVFQPSNREGFSLGLQLQKVISSFVSQQWKYLSNETLTAQQKTRHTWFKPGGTIKRFRAGLSILSPMSKSSGQEHVLKVKMIGPELKVNRLMNRTMAYTIKNTRGELLTYTTNGKRVAVSAVKSPAHITTKQLIELLFSSQAFIQCKSAPTLQHGFLVQVMKYAEQRIPTLNEYCVVCDERHIFQYASMLKGTVRVFFLHLGSDGRSCRGGVEWSRGSGLVGSHVPGSSGVLPEEHNLRAIPLCGRPIQPQVSRLQSQEEELRSTAESSGQHHDHQGDDPGSVFINQETDGHHRSSCSPSASMDHIKQQITYCQATAEQATEVHAHSTSVPVDQ